MLSLNFILCYFPYCLVNSLDVRLTCRNLNSDWHLYLLQDQETVNEAGSVILAESPLIMPESALTVEQPITSVRNMPEDCNRPKTAKCFVFTAFQTEVKIKPFESMPKATPSPLTTFHPHRGCERGEQNQHISMAEIKHISSEEQNEIVMGINEGSV